jgi:vitamin K-dependent gamma-carboxylase
VQLLDQTPASVVTTTLALPPVARARPSLKERLFAPVDIASLVFFRIAFGGIMLWEVWRYFANGWIFFHFIEPRWHFTYYGFDWVRPWPGGWMYVHFAALALMALLIMLGLWYRVATTAFFLGFSYVFLLDEARYLNHFYLVALVSFLLIFVPAHRAFSIDSVTRLTKRSATAPAWALWLLCFQVAVPYFLGGVAKLNGDWLQGQPLRAWLADRTDVPFIGHLFHEIWMVALLNYGSLLFDLLIVPALLWRRTRPFAFVLAMVFNVLNWQLFSIGIFPWFMAAATTLFLRPDWPRVILGRLRHGSTEGNTSSEAKLPSRKRIITALLVVYASIQVLVPLRHLVYPGNVSWTEEGHRFAWHMKLRDKEAVARFFATDRSTGWRREMNPLYYLTEDQYDEMSGRPHMILQFAHYLADQLRAEGHREIVINSLVRASLNGRKRELLIDRSVDLAELSPGFPPAPWIEPLNSPLPHPLFGAPTQPPKKHLE